MINWKRDIVEDAQAVMNANKSLDNKNLISSLTNEIVALRAEIERLETQIHNLKMGAWDGKAVKSITISLDTNGLIDGVQSERYGD